MTRTRIWSRGNKKELQGLEKGQEAIRKNDKDSKKVQEAIRNNDKDSINVIEEIRTKYKLVERSRGNEERMTRT